MPDIQPKPAQPSAPASALPAKKASAAPAKKAPAPTHYTIVHGAVGPWAQDRVLSADELAGIDIDRLLRLGAIAPTAAPDEDEGAADDE